jgi:hypothetical protein
MGIPVYLEVGAKRVFACTLDWPGWCRSGRDEQAALEALVTYRDRYAAVAAEAGVELPPADFEVLERTPGSATTDFGAPGAVPNVDATSLTPEHVERLVVLMRACWTVFDRVVAGAPQELRKGPRGGGRDRDKVVDHVLQAEASYARKLGIKPAAPDYGDPAAVAAYREEVANAMLAPPVADHRWPVRYMIRRSAWHVMDHAWEIEDRSAPTA